MYLQMFVVLVQICYAGIQSGVIQPIMHSMRPAL